MGIFIADDVFGRKDCMRRHDEIDKDNARLLKRLEDWLVCFSFRNFVSGANHHGGKGTDKMSLHKERIPQDQLVMPQVECFTACLDEIAENCTQGRLNLRATIVMYLNLQLQCILVTSSLVTSQTWDWTSFEDAVLPLCVCPSLHIYEDTRRSAKNCRRQ